MEARTQGAGRVILIIPDDPEMEGAGFHVYKLLREMGLEVVLFHTRPNAGLMSAVRANLRALSLLRHRGTPVVCRDGYRTILALTLLKVFGSKVLVWWGGDPMPMAEERSPIAAILTEVGTKILCRLGDILVNIDPVSEERVRSICGRQQRILLEPIDLSRFLSVRGRKKGDYVIFPGRISREKRVHMLLESARRYGFKVVLTGPVYDRSYWESVRLMVDGEIVRYLGVLPKEELARVIAEARVTVIPSVVEGVSTSAIESLAAGTSVIIPETGGYEILKRACSCVFTFRPNNLTPDLIHDLIGKAEGCVPECDMEMLDGRAGWREVVTELLASR